MYSSLPFQTLQKVWIKYLDNAFIINGLSFPAGQDYVPGILNSVNFQPPGDSVVCTSFEIIDDLLGLEDVERFVIDVAPFEGPVTIGRINRTVISIEDNDSTYAAGVSDSMSLCCFAQLCLPVVNIQPSTENEIVFESDGTVEVCLMKNINTTRPIVVDVVVQESTTSSNPATGIIEQHKVIKHTIAGKENFKKTKCRQNHNDHCCFKNLFLSRSWL